MEIITKKITQQYLIENCTTHYQTFIKVVVDLGQRIMAVDAEWHADLELLLLENGSYQTNLWGINLLPFEYPDNFIAYESLINIRPAQKNFSIEIENEVLRDRIKQVIDVLVEYGQKASGVKETIANYGVEHCINGFGDPTGYPCFKHHKQLTLEKWRSFKPYQRILMIANEFGRAKAFIKAKSQKGLFDCYERALELFHITIEAGKAENISAKIIAGLLKLRERTAKLLNEQNMNLNDNNVIREELIQLDPDGYRLFQTPLSKTE